MSTDHSTIPALSTKSILDWVGSRNYHLGLSYFEDNAIVDPRRQGNALKAWCQGSMPSPYRLHVAFGPRNIVESDCSCPVGSGGRCKHVGALLIAWLQEPDTFPVEEGLEAQLQQRSKPELIALIKQMLRIEPDLETVVEMALPGASLGGASADPESYRRQVAAAFLRAGDDWYAQRRVPKDIGITLEAGDGFLAGGDHNGAGIVYQAVAQGTIEYYELVQDDDGELCAMVDRCVEGLEDCLASGVLDPQVRASSLQTLFDIYLFNLDYGGGDTEVTAPDVILEHSTVVEKRAIAGRVRASMPEGDSWSEWYRRRRYGYFLLELEMAHLDDDAFLRICRECDLLPDLVDRLLTLGRTEEAMANAELCSDYDLLAVAEVFRGHNSPQLAESLLIERIRASQNHRLINWLKERYIERGELDSALDLAKQMLERNPRLPCYREVRQLAHGLGVWQELRPQLLERWSAERQDYLLTEVYLEEGEIDLALHSAKQRDFRHPHDGEQLARVAQAASETHPQNALDMYRQLAESLINVRGRENYQKACAFLLKMRQIYVRLSRESEWTDYIAQLREQNCRLPALLEELGNAGL